MMCRMREEREGGERERDEGGERRKLEVERDVLTLQTSQVFFL